MKKLLSTLVCCLVFSAHAEDAKQLTATCNSAQKKGDYAQAVNVAEKALQLSPNDRNAYLCLGRAQGGLGKHEAAVAALQAADKLSSTPLEHVVAMTLLGDQYAATKALPEALAAYRASLAIVQAAKDAHFERINLNQIGETLEAMGDLPGALQSYLQGHKLAANDNERADSSARIAAVCSALGKHDQAIEYQIKALLLEESSGELDNYANAGIEMGRIYTEAKEYANAEKALTKILVIITQSGDVYWEAKANYILGKLRLAQGKPDQAHELFVRAKSLADKVGAEELSGQIASADSGNKTGQ